MRRQKKEEAARRKSRPTPRPSRDDGRPTSSSSAGAYRKGLADRRSNVEKLEVVGPARAVHARRPRRGDGRRPSTRLRFLAFHSEAPTCVHYNTFTVPKKSGGVRTLAAPKQAISAAQHWVLDHLLRPMPTHDAAHGFVPGRSTITNAQPHVGADILINADLTDFFPTITFPRVKGLLQGIGYSPAVATPNASESPTNRMRRFAKNVLVEVSSPRRKPRLLVCTATSNSCD